MHKQYLHIDLNHVNHASAIPLLKLCCVQISGDSFIASGVTCGELSVTTQTHLLPQTAFSHYTNTLVATDSFQSLHKHTCCHRQLLVTTQTHLLPQTAFSHYTNTLAATDSFQSLHKHTCCHRQLSVTTQTHLLPQTAFSHYTNTLAATDSFQLLHKHKCCHRQLSVTVTETHLLPPKVNKSVICFSFPVYLFPNFQCFA